MLAQPASKWTTVFNLFDPSVSVSGDHIKHWYIKRDYSPLPLLVLSLKPDRLEQKILLVGQRGSGKTSELFKLISELRGDYLTVYVDLFGSLDLTEATRVEVLFCLGAAVYKLAHEAHIDLSEKLWLDLVSSLSTLVREETHRAKFDIDPVAALSAVVCTAGVALAPIAAVELGESIRFGLGMSYKDVMQLEVEPVLREVITRVNAILNEITQKSGRSVLLLADGLDKITDFEQAKLIFERSWALTALQCRAIYTAPLTLYHSTAFNELRNYFTPEELPNISLHVRANRSQPHAPGFATLHTLVEKRLVSVGLRVEDVFAEEALQYLIQMSGGVMRDLIALIRQAALVTEYQQKSMIDIHSAQEAVKNRRRQTEAGLFEKHYRALEKIEQNGGIIDRDDSDQMDLLRDGHVVNYSDDNDGFWRDLHPIAWEILADYQTRQK